MATRISFIIFIFIAPLSYEDSEVDLYIIGAVCLSQKSLFLYSKDLVVPYVSRHIPYSKNLVVSPVSGHGAVCVSVCHEKAPLSVLKRFGRFSSL